jgi:hypothetical protein
MVSEIIYNPEAAARLKEQQLRGTAPGMMGNAAFGLGLGSGYGPGAGQPSEVIKIPASLVGYIIGRGGDAIKEIQQRTQTHIQIEKDDEANKNPNERGLIISGSKEGIESAKLGIQHRVATRQAELAQQVMCYFMLSTV